MQDDGNNEMTTSLAYVLYRLYMRSYSLLLFIVELSVDIFVALSAPSDRAFCNVPAIDLFIQYAEARYLGQVPYGGVIIQKYRLGIKYSINNYTNIITNINK